MRNFIFAIVLSLFAASSVLAQETITRGPYLQRLSDTSIIIRWRTDIAVGSSVRYSTNISNLSSVESSNTLTTEHSVTLTGLSAYTRYYYNVGKPGNVSTTGTSSQNFRTAPTPGLSVATKIWVLGDSGTADSNAQAVRDAYKTYAGTNGDSDFILMLGDNAYNSGTDSEYQNAVFDIYPEVLLKTPVWSTLGNHDGYSASSATQSGPYYDIFDLPTNADVGGVASGTEAYYSFDYGNIHFVCLNSYDVSRGVNDTMLQWLQSDLDVNDKEWLIVFFHHPPYTKGSHNSDGETRLIDMRQNALPILEAAGVDLVLTGHSHSYERSFLIDGHYGLSTTFNSSMQKDSGDGKPSGNGAYTKHSGLMGGNAGAVYAVAGSSGKISGGALNHPAMYVSLNSLGSMVLDISGSQLDVIFLNSSGTIQDSFTIEHQTDATPPQLVSVSPNSISLLTVNFSEQVQELSAETLSNYTITPSISVLNANLSADKKSVTLTTSPLSVNTVYALFAKNVADISGNPLPANSHKTFSYKISGSVSFQSGVSPVNTYNGYTDTHISQQNPTTNYGTNSPVEIDGDDPGSSNNDLTGLLRWDISAVPSGAVATAASITIGVSNVTSHTYNLYQALKSWDETGATWNNATGSTTWQTAGATGASDRGTTILTSFSPTSTGAYKADLNSDGVTTVNQWLGTPSSNYGFILGNTTATDGLDFYSSNEGTASYRPIFTIDYEIGAGAGDSTPPSAPGNLISPAQTRKTISLSWDAASDDVAVIAYGIFRDGALIDLTTATSFVDSNLIPETSYQYNIVAYDAAPNASANSNTLNISTLDADTDKDGVDDDQEALDGTNPNDRGSYLEKLATHSCTEWNGFLSMYNFLELLNRSSSAITAAIDLYNISGSKVSSVSVSIPAHGQWDQPIHSLSGFSANSYGLVCVTHSGLAGQLWGQMVLYRPLLGGFEFAMSLPLSNGVTGEQDVAVNTFNPNSLGNNAIANWIQLTNFTDSSVSGTLDFYSENGAAISGGSFSVTLAARSRRDISAHQFGANFIGSAKWTPSDSTKAVSLRNARYVYDNPNWLSSFLTAAPIRGRQGTGEKLYVPVSRQFGESVIELVNTSASSISVAVDLFSESGASITSLALSIGAHASKHVPLNSYFAAGTLGSASIQSSLANSLVSTVMQYDNSTQGLELMYALRARQALGTTAYNSFNTYVSHSNALQIVSAIASASTPSLTLRNLQGTIILNGASLSLGANAVLTRDLNADAPSDSYGQLELTSSAASNAAWVLRRRGNDYLLPFEVLP